MNQIELIEEQLQKLGFETRKIEDVGYIFNYNELNYLYMPDENDENFLRISVPQIYDVTDENRLGILNVVQDTNCAMKYIKAIVIGSDSVWLFYEYRLFSNEQLGDILEHMISALHAAYMIFQQKVNGEDEE